jgi:serine/threonine protein kinase
MNQNKKGGAIIGHGSYGCVVDPAIKYNKTSVDGKVSKILMELDISEVNYGKKLIKIDPDNKYFIYVLETHVIKNNISNISNKDINDCRKILGVGRTKQLFNLIMVKGDMSLYDYFNSDDIESDIQLNIMYKIILKLLLCSRVLLENGLTHYDIKADNVILRKINKKFEIMMIDFGGNFNPENWNDLKDNIVSINTKYLWPREVYKFKKVPSINFIDYSEKVMVYMIGEMFNGIKYKQIIPLIRGMINPDSSKRLTIKQCMELIKRNSFLTETSDLSF